MKSISIRMKITLWFSVALILIVALTVVVVFSVSDAVMQKGIKDNLIETVESNVNEIVYVHDLDDDASNRGYDIYIEYNGGYLEIDDDFLDKVNGITTALYHEDGMLLYGENPLARYITDMAFLDSSVQNITLEGVRYYIFDRCLSQQDEDRLPELWLRGIVSEKQGADQLSSIVHFSMIVLPVLVCFAIFGGYLISKRTLYPIKLIGDAAARITQGKDLKMRIALGEGDDELHRLANTFDAMFERLDASFEAEKQFTSDASHELRTPMSVIMAQCEYTLEKQRTIEEYKDALWVIRRQGGKMSRLISDMLDFTRLERKADSFEREIINFSLVVTSICEDMALLHDKNITLDHDVEGDILVMGNRGLLSRLVTNLISNAYRYGNENGHINVTLTLKDDEALLTVADDGIGMSKEQQLCIFNRFYQADTSHASGGTGLGLSMVREIAGFHNGSISVTSELGKGSVFKFSLKSFKS